MVELERCLGAMANRHLTEVSDQMPDFVVRRSSFVVRTTNDELRTTNIEYRIWGDET